MRIKQAIRVGLAFGFALVIGGAAAAAISSTTPSELEPKFSAEPLAVFSDSSALLGGPQDAGFEQPIPEELEGSTIYRSAESDAVSVYIADLEDGSLCVLAASESDGIAMTCGTAEMAAAGRVGLRTQNRPQDPSLFVGIAPNDVTGVRVDGESGVVSNNAYIASGSPDTDTYTLEGADGQQVTIDMSIDQTFTEQPGSGS